MDENSLFVAYSNPLLARENVCLPGEQKVRAMRSVNCMKCDSERAQPLIPQSKRHRKIVACKKVYIEWVRSGSATTVGS